MSPGADWSPRLAALVVNFNSGAFAVGCVQSLLMEWEAEGWPRENLDVVVVENASPADQTEYLAQLEELGARVVQAGENLGYARGMNRAYEETSGGRDDFVGILNPDLCFLPGSVRAMLAYLHEHRDVGAVDPRAFIDTGELINLPRNLLPTITEHLRTVFAQVGGAPARAYSKLRFAKNLPWWESPEPMESDMLSGCCVLLRRGVVEELGRPMDAAYPLYYEDTDLFRQIAKLGYKLVHLNTARVLHHWSRSSGVGEQFEGEPHRRFLISQRHYFTKYYGRLGYWFVQAFNRLGTWLPKSRWFQPMHPIEYLGEFGNEPIDMALPRSCEYVIELTMAPTWTLTVAVLGEGDRWVCTQDAWEWMFQGVYFFRAVDRRTGEFLGAWNFTKTTPGRDRPCDMDELRRMHEERKAQAVS